MALRWLPHGDGVVTEDAGTLAVHARDGPDAAAAAVVLTHGRHTVTLEIVRSERNRGFMYLGVVAADGGGGAHGHIHRHAANVLARRARRVRVLRAVFRDRHLRRGGGALRPAAPPCASV